MSDVSDSAGSDSDTDSIKGFEEHSSMRSEDSQQKEDCIAEE